MPKRNIPHQTKTAFTGVVKAVCKKRKPTTGQKVYGPGGGGGGGVGPLVLTVNPH